MVPYLLGAVAGLIISWFLFFVIPHMCIQKMQKRKEFRGCYISILIASGEENIDFKMIEASIQKKLEFLGAICWTSRSDVKDSERLNKMNADASAYKFSLVGILQREDTGSPTHFHTVHFQRWYERDRPTQMRFIQGDRVSHTAPVRIRTTDRMLDEAYQASLEEAYNSYTKKFCRSPFIETERQISRFRLAITFKMTDDRFVAANTFFQEGEAGKYTSLIDGFAKDVIIWIQNSV